MRVDLQDLTKVFDTDPAVDSLDLAVGDGEFLSLLGPSGCGKTTTLLMLAGFEEPTRGRVAFGGRDVTGVAPRHRNIGMCFQSYALYPSMTALENIAFPLRVRREPRADRERRACRYAELLDIAHLLHRLPATLSGGQQQRVALARALTKEPDVLLLDEPLSNLDAKLRLQMRSEIRDLTRDLGVTTIMVTHDQMEAMAMSDRIAVLRDGRLQQVADPRTLYHGPANLFVAEFVGSAPLNMVEIAAGGRVADLPLTLATPCGIAGPAVETILAFRPQDADFLPRPEGRARVVSVEPMGHDVLIRLETPVGALRVTAADQDPPTPGAVGDVVVEARRAMLFDRATGRRLPVA